ncbi:MAG: hypothetical protein NWE89_01615 [Candidatus Bathyarchaeota archaeon]|nr:hypothetical protein [Candidatus Bathyarchaeota archaeon]
MSSLPKLSDEAKKKPIGYNPETQRFIYYDDVVDGREPVTPLTELSEQDKTKLILERLRTDMEAEEKNLAGKSKVAMGFEGPVLDKKQLMEQVKAQTSFGRIHLNAEISYINDLLATIEEALLERDSQKKQE